MSILNINGGGGSYIRFMPSANAWVYDKSEVTIDVIVFDQDTVRTGWGKMSEGNAPEWQWDERLGVGGPQPSSEHKRGFAIKLFAKGIGTVEWSSTGTGPVIGFDAIFEQIWNQKAANPGKVPVVKYTGSTSTKIGKGNTRVPNFQLVKWADRDSVPWGNEEKAEAAPAAAPAPAAKPAPAKAAPAAAPVDDDISFV
jgi:hypothetical protein